MDSGSFIKLIFFSCFLLKSIHAYTAYTIHIPPGSVECFYQQIKDDKSLNIVYQVTAGGQLDIDFHVASPSGKVLFSERRNNGIQRQSYRVEDAETGDYEICFGNKFSHLSSKTIYFGFEIDSDVTTDLAWKGFVQPDEDFGERLELMKEEVSSIKDRMDQIVEAQSLTRVYERRDRSIAERNFELVNLGSGINVFAMLFVFLLQVYIIRQMFDDGRKVRP